MTGAGSALRRRWPVLLALPALAFVVLPVVGLAARAPWSDAWGSLGRAGARTALIVSLQVSLGATAIALVLGFPAAWVLARVRFPGRRLVRAVVTLPIVLPPVVAGVALLAALGRVGFLGRALHAIGISLPFTTAGTAVAAAFVSWVAESPLTGPGGGGFMLVHRARTRTARCRTCNVFPASTWCSTNCDTLGADYQSARNASPAAYIGKPTPCH